jgi:hypothetical protein
MATRRSGSGAPAASEFLILRVGERLQPGATVTFVGAAASPDAAMEMVQKMNDTDSARLLIVECQAVVWRRPTMSVEVVDEPAVTS